MEHLYSPAVHGGKKSITSVLCGFNSMLTEVRDNGAGSVKFYCLFSVLLLKKKKKEKKNTQQITEGLKKHSQFYKATGFPRRSESLSLF